MSELTKRTLFALVAAPIFIAVTYFGGWIFRSFIGVIGAFVVFEIITLYKAKDINAHLFFALLFASWVYFHALIPLADVIGYLLFLVYVSKEVLTPPHSRLIPMMVTMFAGVYPALGFVGFIEIRNTGIPSVGLWLTVLVVFLIWANDVFAYFGGRAFGKHAMAPEISPKKTWEGFISGMLGSAAIGFLFTLLFPESLPFSYVYVLPMAVIAGTFGPIGDLAGSKMKRYTGAKDSGNFLPGHGGFFDRFDSFFLVCPAIAAYLQILIYLGVLHV